METRRDIRTAAGRAGRLRLALAAIGTAALVASCAPASVRTTQAYEGPPLARPDRVLVYDFAVSPDQVKLDSGVGPRLLRALQSAPPSAEQATASRQVAEAVAQNLVAEIQKLGLPAERAAGAPPPSGENRLLVQGDILSIDEGNRARRVIIGFGAGSSEVKAETQVFYDANGAGPRLVQSYSADAGSSRKSGMAETMGAGAAAGRLATSAAVGGGVNIAAEGNGTEVDKVAAHMAKQIAKNLAQFFASQGWISAAATP